MTRRTDSTPIEIVLEILCEHGFEGMASAIETLINEAMKIERSAYLQAEPYERTGDRRGHANGFKGKRMKTRVGELALRVPQVRNFGEDAEPFYPRALERGVRSERALKLAIAEMYVQGVSTRKVVEITRELCGLDVSSTEVSRAAKALDEELESWRTRPLGEMPYLMLDARYEKVRHGGSVVDAAVLIASGVRQDGKRSLLGVSVALSEAEVHWREFLESLQDRGLHGVRYIVSDDHAGLKEARKARFPGVPWQRCQVHLQRNATAYVPRVDMRPEVARDLRGIFHSQDLAEAQERCKRVATKYRRRAPRLAQWIEENIPQSFAVFELPVAHRRRVRSTNMLERLNREIKRRTKVATLFPNEASLLRLVSSVLSEISEEWESGKVYLSMEAK
jgi:transposase-like protein